MPTLKESPAEVKGFMQYPATQRLHQLAQQAIDLSLPKTLTPDRIRRFIAESCDIKFLYATEKVDEQVIESLRRLATESKAIEKMKKMQQGEVMNFIQGYPSENRPVLHTAVRDFFENKISSDKTNEARELALKEIEKLKQFIKNVDQENRFTDLIFIAIGGSELGPQAHYVALEHLKKQGRNIFFISNVDPDDAARVLHQANLSKSLVLVVSKAGTTLETVTNADIVRQKFIQQGLHPKDHFIAITGKCSPMDKASEYLEVFYIWDWVGGRFSTTSMVGGVLLSFAFGFEVYWEFLRGASAMDKAALLPDLHKNIPLLGALIGIWNHNFLGYATLAIVPYSQALRRYSAHLQQVDMESHGKRIDQDGARVDFETGPIVWGEPGTDAQHSFHQLLHQGTAVVPVEFIGFKESQYQEDALLQGTTSQEKLLSNLFAQSIALATGRTNENPNKFFPGNRPSHILLARKLTPFLLGNLLSYYENKIAFQGFIWNINSFDQEGVQLGKILASQIISCFSAIRNGSAFEYPVGEAYLKILENL